MNDPVSGRSESVPVSWGMIGLLMAQAAMGHFNRVSISVAGSECLMAEHGLSEAKLGMVYSAFLLGYTLFMIPGGWMTDRQGGRILLTCAGVGTSLCVIATGLLGSMPAMFSLTALIAVRFCTGVAGAPLHPAAAQLVSRCVPVENRTFVNGLIIGSATIGVAVTFTIFGMLIDSMGWSNAFLASGLLTVGITVLWSTYSGRHLAAVCGSRIPVSHSHPPAEPVALCHPRLLCLAVSYATVGYFHALFFYWLQHYFLTVHGLSVVESRWFTTIPTLAMAAGMPCGGWISDRLTLAGYSRGLVPSAGLVLSAILVGLGVSCTRPETAIIFLTLALGTAGACEGPFWTTAAQLGGSRGGLFAAVVNTGGNAGGMLAPLLTPLLSSRIGWSGAVGAAGGLCVLGAILWRWVDGKSNRVQPTKDS